MAITRNLPNSRNRFPPHLLAMAMLVVTALLRADDQFAAGDEISHGERLFAIDVQPLLARKCFACHGADPNDIQGGLDLTHRAGMLAGGESGEPALVENEAAQSPLYQALTWEDELLQMPPKEADRLTEQETWFIRDWINAGARWPDEDRIRMIRETHTDENRQSVATSGGQSQDWDERTYTPDQLWAYQPLARPNIPGDVRATNPIDAFLNVGINAAGITPAHRADRRTLIRRASFDLLGLPPSPSEIDAFLNDPADDKDAFASLIDRLLASPHYGERMAQHWLDVVRYADSAGFANDYERPNTWRYRDYVVRAFNNDVPYDEFIRQQIAGDELDAENPEFLVATGFLRMGPWEHTGMSVARVTRQQFLDDITDAVGQVFLSHPLQCCRCHDHKFDPIPTRDYYRIQAVFGTTQFADREAPFLDVENTTSFEQPRSYLEQRIKHYEGILVTIAAKEEDAARAWYAERGLEYAPRQELIRRGVPEEMIAPRRIGLTATDHGLERIARKGLERHRWELDRYQPIAYSVYNGATREVNGNYGRVVMPMDPMTSGDVEQTHILAGGDVFSPTMPVTPGVLSCLFASQAQPIPVSESGGCESLEGDESHEIEAGEWADLLIPDTVEGRRLAFANWLTAPDHPLVSRSIANRIWQWHFGRGLVATPNNFGTMGRRPSHPELLDWLARRFVDEGWSFKAMHRLIMTSDAYCRSCEHPDRSQLAERDPQGTSYAVFEPRRLTAEEIRDATLTVTGELNREIGGIPICPDMNLEAALQPRQVMGTYAPAWQPSPLPEQRHRRSLYILRLRGLNDPFMDVFNRPGPDKSCDLREASTVTPQVFALFNSQSTSDRSLAFAHRLLESALDDTETIHQAFELALGRSATPDEVDYCLAHWSEMTQLHKTLEFTPTTLPERVTRSAIDELTGEVFEFVEELEQHQDYIPDLKPWQADARERGLADLCLVLLNLNEFVYVY